MSLRNDTMRQRAGTRGLGALFTFHLLASTPEQAGWASPISQASALLGKLGDLLPSSLARSYEQARMRQGRGRFTG